MAMRRGGVDLARRMRSGASAMQAQPAMAFDQASHVGSFEPEGARHASLQAVKTRMKSVENISKITKAMKMVAASRLRAVQERTEESRGFPLAALRVMGDYPTAPVENATFVPVTSDKGLCGGINSTVSKFTRVIMKMAPDLGNEKTELFVVGDKGRAQLVRGATAELVSNVVMDSTKNAITFAQAGMIADYLSTSGFDKVSVMYNRFHSAISFKPTIVTILTPEQYEKHTEGDDVTALLDDYELEGPIKTELMRDLFEFHLGSVLHQGMLENNCSELGSRMQAMENSTKNAGEMLDKLTLYYNRTRQAKITTELIEIISGAEALSQMK